MTGEREKLQQIHERSVYQRSGPGAFSTARETGVDMSEHSIPPGAGLVTIARQAQRALSRDVWQRHTTEACGLLLGQADIAGCWHVTDVLPLRNIYNSPVYFEFAPEDLLKAELEHADEIIGVYHSHPTGLRRASATDRANMQRINVEQQIPWIWFIISGPFRQNQAQGQLEVVAYQHDAQLGLRTLHVTLQES